MSQFRVESDSMGEVRVPKTALYGAQTQRAVDNFQLSGLVMPMGFIQALALIKQTAAEANAAFGLLDSPRCDAIVAACQAIIEGQHQAEFPVDVFQTGSGTSSNMNANEVIARLAQKQSGLSVLANDHVNMSQSSNDVIPTAIHLSAALALSLRLLPALDHLALVLEQKAVTLHGLVKTGRTHLMDAMPVSMPQVLQGWACQVQLSRQRLEQGLHQLLSLAQGGTAVGTGINAHVNFSTLFCTILSAKSGLNFVPSKNFFCAIGSQDVAVSVSGELKTCAVSLTKIANDLRWMNSGPLAGLGEIALPELQPGSSIMPGKVNPVIPEAVAMIAAQVIGNDTTITMAGQSANFELNVMLPVIGYNLLQSIELLSNGSIALADKAISGFIVNEDKLKQSLSCNPILVTALTPIIGYENAAKIAKKAYSEHRPIIDVAVEETELDRVSLEAILDPNKLTQGGLAE
ncbi:lyase family protein [Shewanella sp. SR44-3]|uniref:class II fumarate hydratase n=1 Tax=Shewanella sp. SR44-3 TaxID=2760936 RepID=UPI0015FCBD51|nr:class II fumarate hydratase [Shewanella sp. SR44-3]MBB1270759.1 class II fumarate hydratase [Shewanella sp. SR44-3]